MWQKTSLALAALVSNGGEGGRRRRRPARSALLRRVGVRDDPGAELQSNHPHVDDLVAFLDSQT